LNEALKEGARAGTESHGRKRLRGLLVVAEVALTLVLLVGAGLMLKSFLRLLEVNPGFQPDHLLTARISLPPARYAEDQKIIAFHQELISRLKSLPGVQAVGVSMSLPPNQLQFSSDFGIEGRPFAHGQRRPVAEELSNGACSSSKSASIKPRVVAKRAASTDSKDYGSIHGQQNYWP
jgi:hypothetical protein